MGFLVLFFSLCIICFSTTCHAILIFFPVIALQLVTILSVLPYHENQTILLYILDNHCYISLQYIDNHRDQ